MNSSTSTIPYNPPVQRACEFCGAKFPEDEYHADSCVYWKKLYEALAWHIKQEKCSNDGGCMIMSNSRRMCVACRLKMMSFHLPRMAYLIKE